MPSLILDTGFETYRLTSDNSVIWQAAPYMHSPLHVFIFVFNILLHFVTEVFHLISGKSDRGLKVERLKIPSASRMFTTISNLCLATDLISSDKEQSENKRGCIQLVATEFNHPCSKGSDTCMCKKCRKYLLESTLFQNLLKLSNRFNPAKSSHGLHGLLSFSKQRQLLEFPTLENEIIIKCDNEDCNNCSDVNSSDNDGMELDFPLYDDLLSRLAILEEHVSGATINSRTARAFIDWVDSSFGVSDSGNG